ncbi:MAG: heme o synthase [Bacteroidia bacterium]|nr:heme o synthase [Bacteroidia bacterium]
MTTPTAQARPVGAWRDYLALGKPRLSALVVFSAVVGYALGQPGWAPLAWLTLALGGWGVTAGANALNQWLEAPYDARMRRTADRPLPTGRLQPLQAVGFALVCTAVGVGLIAVAFNTLAALLALTSTLLYAFAYTPLKRHSPVAVLVGAVPGGLPPLIGYVAATGSVNAPAVALFALQFAWQLPHFWAIAWLGYDDYAAAGYRLMPTPGGRTPVNAAVTFLSALLVIPAGLLPIWGGLAGMGATVALVGLGVAFALPAANFWQRPSRTGALEVMFASFFYLPLAQVVLILDSFL